MLSDQCEGTASRQAGIVRRAARERFVKLVSHHPSTLARSISLRFPAALLIALLAIGAVGPNAAALSMVTTIPVGTYPSWVAINPLTNTLYVTNYNSNGSVSVINGNSNQVIADIPTGQYPRSVAVNPNTNRAYVTNHESSTLSVIDLATNKVLGNPVSIRLPWHVAVNPTTNRGYVTVTGDSKVVVLDLSTAPPTIIDTLPTGSSPLDVVVNPVTNRFYVGVGSPTSIYVFDGVTDAQIATVMVGDPSAIPDRLALNTQTNRLYASVQLSSEHIAVIDTTSNQVVANVPVGGVPDGIGVDEATNQIYVGDLTTPFYLWQIDGTTNTVVGTLVPGNTPLGVGVSSQTCRVYTANAQDNTVSVINVSPPAAKSKVATMPAPATIARTSTMVPRAYLPLVSNVGCP